MAKKRTKAEIRAEIERIIKIVLYEMAEPEERTYMLKLVKIEYEALRDMERAERIAKEAAKAEKLRQKEAAKFGYMQR